VITLKYPLLFIAVTSTLVVGSLTGFSVAAFAAGSPEAPTEIVSSPGLTVPVGYQPREQPPLVSAPAGVTVVSVAAAIPTEPEENLTAETPSAGASSNSSHSTSGAPDSNSDASHANSSKSENSDSGSSKSNDDSNNDNNKSNNKDSGKSNQSQNVNGKGKDNEGPAGQGN
jgi:hypothetical protein